MDEQTTYDVCHMYARLDHPNYKNSNVHVNIEPLGERISEIAVDASLSSRKKILFRIKTLS